MGDFNMPDIELTEDDIPVLNKVSSSSSKVCDAIAFSGFVQIVNDYTFFSSEKSKSLLDLILVSHPNRVSEVENCPTLGINPSSLRFWISLNIERQSLFESRSFNWKYGHYLEMNSFLND
ncbi:hypothetical protein BpHYR1_045587 [Brachionus plicatilis]|uniref:RNA-directed DNA polymerase from mobile element jockey-like n=1 Tax=Brachionus plicatilis TaxID=10195 RepID=A0A3M7QQ70_BRAPC|nr:hypothetical protein BpHYR1_045587 [Brachionus plicatilis]